MYQKCDLLLAYIMKKILGCRFLKMIKLEINEMAIKRFLGFAFLFFYKNQYLEFHSEEVLNFSYNMKLCENRRHRHL